MRVRDPQARQPDAAKVAALKVFIGANPDASFDDIRVGVTGFAGATDGAIHQVAIDAGFEVTDD